MKKLLGILVLGLLLSGNAEADKSINDWSGLYLGVYQSEDHLSASATSTLYSPYSISTDENIYNTGYFVGYNYSINNLIVGIEAGEQDNVGKDKAITGHDGYIEYDDMQEYKLKIGYSLDKYLVYTFFGTGDLNVYWSAYAQEVKKKNDFEIKGIGLSAKITNNIFVGLSYSETNLDIYYQDTLYNEPVQLDSLRLRFGYLF
jgi:opacity protein-like surface antigen